MLTHVAMTDTPFYISTEDPPAKQRILEEALRLFAARGLSGTSIRDIAEATGYSNPALYKHFETKDALARVLFERCYREVMARLNRAVEGEEGFEDRFRAYVGSYATFYDEHPHALIFISNHLAELWPDISKNIGDRTIITQTRELIRLGQREGRVGNSDDVSLKVTLVIGAISQLLRQLYFRELDGPASNYANEIERMLRAGLA